VGAGQRGKAVQVGKKQPKVASKQIIQAIMEKANVKQARAYEMIRDVKRSRAVDVRTAANYVAAKLNIDVQQTKYGLTNFDKQRLRDLLAISEPVSATTVPSDTKSKITSHPSPIQIGSKVAEILLLTPTLVKQANEMSGVYPLVYVLENSFRQLIFKNLERKYGKGWWDRSNISGDIRKKVASRLKQEDENRWHSKRGAHPVFYTDLNDVGAIIINNWSEFKGVFKKQYRLQAKLEEIELSRNIIAHSNPLPDKEIKRLKLNFDDWTRMLKEQK
jgi:hypothetical protein